MINYPAIDPVAISVGPVDIHWYGIMYLIGFAAAWWLAPIQASRQGVLRDRREIEDLIFYAAIGVIIGGRLGYTLFYNLPHFLNDPLSLLRIWQGGMSFHGGLLGVVTACYIYARNHRLKLFQVTDLAAPLVPIGLLAGRIGNFINGELWGRSSDLPWAMVFPGAGPLPRHPSQLYEALLEGVVLFLILWFYTRRPRPVMAISALFLIGYATARGLVEFVREPDAHIGYLYGNWLTMGHLLSLPMLLFGLLLLALACRNQRQTGNDSLSCR